MLKLRYVSTQKACPIYTVPNSDSVSTRNYAEVLKPLNLRSSFVSSNVSIRNSHWDAFDHERGWIALPHSEARDQNLPLGLNLPDDNSKGLFILNAYHQMHCLVGTLFSSNAYVFLTSGSRRSSAPHCTLSLMARKLQSVKSI